MLHHFVLVKIALVEITLKMVANLVLNGSAKDVILFNFPGKVAVKQVPKIVVIFKVSFSRRMNFYLICCR